MKKSYTIGFFSLMTSVKPHTQLLKNVGLFALLLVITSASVFSQTNYYLRTDSVNAKNVYVKPDITKVAAWSTDGKVTGTRPADFTSDGQIFNIQTNGITTAGFSLNKVWTVSGAGSKIVIGAKDSIILFTAQNAAVLTGTIDVLTNASLVLQVANTSTISFGTLVKGSTVRYSGNATASQQVIAHDYANLNLNLGATALPVTLPTEKIGVSGTFVSNNKYVQLAGSTFDFNGTGGQLINGNTFYNLVVSGTKSTPDTLRGTSNIAGMLSNTSGTDLNVSTTNLNGTITYSTINYSGLVPQTSNLAAYGNLNYINGQNFYISSMDNAAKTITLYGANPELKVGFKIAANATANPINLDTSTVITAITNDTVLTLSNAPTLRAFLNHAGHLTGVKPDTIYIASYSLVDSSITLANGTAVVGDTINSQIIATKTLVTAVSGNVATLSALKSFTNPHNLQAVVIGSADKKASDKIIVGLVTILNALNAGTGNIATDGSTVYYAGKKQAIAGITYDNLKISQDSAYTATLSANALVKGVFTLEKGKLTTATTKLLTLDVNASFTTVTNDTFFVNGPLAKNFASTTPFTYQIGAVTAGVAHPRTVVITPNTADARTYSAAFAVGKVANSTKADSIGVFTIDTASYYTVAVSNYTVDSAARISFQYRYDTSIIGKGLVLAHYVGTKFKAEGSTLVSASGPTVAFGSITTDNFISVFGRFAFGFNPSLVPVKFSSVSAATQANGTVKVSWKSATEVNVSKYVVETSADGVTFSSKGSVTAIGVSGYSFIDVAPATGVSYYRVKAIDNDGKATYSSVVSINENGFAAKVSVYPNPVLNKQLNLVLNTASANYTVKVTNVIGQNILSRSINHNGGTTAYSIELPSSTQAGTYFIKVSDGTTQTTKTVIIK